MSKCKNPECSQDLIRCFDSSNSNYMSLGFCSKECQVRYLNLSHTALSKEYWRTIDQLSSYSDAELYGLAEAIKAHQNSRKEKKLETKEDEPNCHLMDDHFNSV